MRIFATYMSQKLSVKYKNRVDFSISIIFFSIGACLCYAVMSLLEGKDEIVLIIFAIITAISAGFAVLNLQKERQIDSLESVEDSYFLNNTEIV